ncbi:permease [Candidatus Woesearchaeota archaeon]|nr:permease [Candidatus Woesearchaeota archaeon]
MMYAEILARSGILFAKILPLVIIGIVAGKLVDVYVPKSFVRKYLNGNGSLLAVSALAMLTPGPFYATLPVLDAFRRKGASYGIIVAYITSDLMVGPMRVFLETHYFGILYTVVRLVITYFISIGMGLGFMYVEKKGWLGK